MNNPDNFYGPESIEAMFSAAVERMLTVPLNRKRMKDAKNPLDNALIRGATEGCRDAIKIHFQLQQADGHAELDALTERERSLQSIITAEEHQYSVIVADQMARNYLDEAVIAFLDEDPDFVVHTAAYALSETQNDDPVAFYDEQLALNQDAESHGTSFEYEVVKQYLTSLLIRAEVEKHLFLALREETK